MQPYAGRERAWQVVDELAEAQAGALGRRQLAARGVPRWLVRGELRARRWQPYGRQVLVVHNGPIAVATARWAAVLAVGRRAALDGVTALQVAGLDALTDGQIHVITPKSSTPERPRGVVVHESRRFREDDVLQAGLRRTRPAVAAVHGALWARTDREAAYLLVLTVQQRLATPEQLAEALDVVRRHHRRGPLRAVVLDLLGGVRAMSELDVARDFRAAGLPEPDRQVLRQRPGGRYYLDCRLAAYDVTLELDGTGHDDALQRVDDVVRDLRLAADGELVLRVPMVAYRLGRERVLAAVAELLRRRGWQAAA